MLRSFLSPLDLTKKEVLELFIQAKKLKKQPRSLVLQGRSLGMIFQKPSTRTRVSFESGMTQLGGHALYLNPTDLQLSRGETIADTARVLSSYIDIIMARVYNHTDIEELAKHALVPVINGLSDLHHPCQALADIFTLWEKFKNLEGKTIAFVGDGDNNVTNSLLLLSSMLGINFIVAAPKQYMTRSEIIQEAKKFNTTITTTNNPQEAVKNADVVVTDVWVSMGRKDKNERLKALGAYQINELLLEHAPHAYVLHCLPAHRGQEITDGVIDGPQSLVWQEAENRIHVQKALLLFLLT